MAEPVDRKPSTDPYPGAPTWVKVFGLAFVVLLVLVVVVLAGSVLGLHTPGGHGM